MKNLPIYTDEIKNEIRKEISIEIGKLIRKKRKEKGLSMEQLSHILDSNKQNIYKLLPYNSNSFFYI